MRNILIIASGYCGNATANGLCAQALAKDFEQNGIAVHVISCDLHKEDCISENNVISVQRSPKKKTNPTKSIFGKGWQFFKKRLLYTFTPQYDKAVTEKIIDTGKQICQKTKIDAIICMYFPLEAVVAGYKLKKVFPDICFVTYELDSVADGIAGGSKWNKYLLFSYKRFLGHIYKKVDFVAVLECHKHHWIKENKRYKQKMKLVDLPLLKDTKLMSRETHRDGISFLYSGALDDSYRSPNSVLKAFELLNDNIDYKIDFYSKGCEETLGFFCENNKRLNCHGYVGQAVLEEAVAESNFLISIGNKVSNSLPSKIITYMSYGKPIIHFCLQKEDVCKAYFEKYPLSLIIEYDEPPIVAAVRIKEFAVSNYGKIVPFNEICEALPMNLPSYSSQSLINSIYRKEC